MNPRPRRHTSALALIASKLDWNKIVMSVLGILSVVATGMEFRTQNRVEHAEARADTAQARVDTVRILAVRGIRLRLRVDSLIVSDREKDRKIAALERDVAWFRTRLGSRPVTQRAPDPADDSDEAYGPAPPPEPAPEPPHNPLKKLLHWLGG